MGRIARTVIRLLLAVLSLFAVPHAFPAFLYQTPAVQEHVLLPPRDGSGGPLIVWWTHVIVPAEVRPAADRLWSCEAVHEDADLHPAFPIDVWLESAEGLLRLERHGSEEHRLEIGDGYLRIVTPRDPTGATLVVFKAVCGDISPQSFNARDYFPQWPPAWA
jgi:hypothetical protein